MNKTLLSLATVVALGLAAAPAQAGTYTVYACNAAGRQWDNRSWEQNAPINGVAADQDCAGDNNIGLTALWYTNLTAGADGYGEVGGLDGTDHVPAVLPGEVRERVVVGEELSVLRFALECERLDKLGHEAGHILSDHVLYRTALIILLQIGFNTFGRWLSASGKRAAPAH